ncbi:TetR/AcrR family transcriptional regulator [Nocardioides sp. LHG3406-4]|uniref:TetR/AcrR family transcriptional regulator n=1 Tax=Nocardioides sp. LHG3406-4 TaxID=2804575 RepID=UPI003CF93E86
MRSARATETRRRVVEAASESFLEAGYAATTLSAIAARAGVSVDTVYKTFGSKIALLKEVLDVVIGGDDDPLPMLERPGPQAVRTETDQRVQVRMLAKGVAGQLERIRPLDDILRGAAAVDAEAAALREDIQVRQRGTAMRTFAGWIAANGPLRDGQSAARAGQVVWTLTSPEVHLMLRDTSGWSRRAYEKWLEQAIAAAILEPRRTPSI